MTVTPRSLSHAEFQATFSDPMEDITGREDSVQPEGVIDIVPYLRALGPDNLGGLELLPGERPASVYLTADRRFNHVLYKCNRSNTYAVVVVIVDAGEIYGHHVLDVTS